MSTTPFVWERRRRSISRPERGASRSATRPYVKRSRRSLVGVVDDVLGRDLLRLREVRSSERARTARRDVQVSPRREGPRARARATRRSIPSRREPFRASARAGPTMEPTAVCSAAQSARWTGPACWSADTRTEEEEEARRVAEETERASSAVVRTSERSR